MFKYGDNGSGTQAVLVAVLHNKYTPIPKEWNTSEYTPIPKEWNINEYLSLIHI